MTEQLRTQQDQWSRIIKIAIENNTVIEYNIGIEDYDTTELKFDILGVPSSPNHPEDCIAIIMKLGGREWVALARSLVKFPKMQHRRWKIDPRDDQLAVNLTMDLLDEYEQEVLRLHELEDD